MTDLRGALAEVLASAFADEGLDAAYGRVTASDRPDLADFQCNGALAAAKAAKANPRDIAGRIVARIGSDPRLSGVEIAGPGFINIKVSDQALAERARALAVDPMAGASPVEAPRRVVIDYAGPNVAKPMHVGHLRSSIIGESLKRLFRFRGDTVWGDAHFGDWGFQMGLLIVALREEQPDLAYFGDGPFPQTSPVTLEDLERLYPVAAARAKTEPEFRDLARKATAELQAGRPGYRALWRHFVDVSRTALEREFHALGVDFDLWKGESDADPLIPEMVEDLKAKGLAVQDQGALIVRVAREGDKRELPPLLVLSSEGSAMYGTTDLATVLDRRREFDPHLILYLTDQRQADHFEQVFRASYLAGYAPEGSLEHIGFGTMNGSDGKPFKTREGGVLKLHDLIEMTRAKARDRLQEAGLGAELPPGVRGDGAQGGGGGPEVRGPVELPRHLVRVRPRSLHQLRRQDRPLPPLPGGTDQIPDAQGRGRRRHRWDDNGRRSGRAGAGSDAGRFRPGVGGGLRQACAQRPGRARLSPGPGLLEVLCRLPCARGGDAGCQGLAPGSCRGDPASDGDGAGTPWDRNARPDVSADGPVTTGVSAVVRA